MISTAILKKYNWTVTIITEPTEEQVFEDAKEFITQNTIVDFLSFNFNVVQVLTTSSSRTSLLILPESLPSSLFFLVIQNASSILMFRINEEEKEKKEEITTKEMLQHIIEDAIMSK